MSTATTTAPETPSTDADVPRPTGTTRSGRGWFVRIAVIGIVTLWMIPTVGLFISSFRTRNFINSEGWWTAFVRPFAEGQWTLDHYATVLGQSRGFGNAFVNSLAVSIPATVIPITIAMFAAYAFSWMHFKGRYLLFVGVVALIAVPLHVALIPVLRLYQQGMEIFGVTIFPALNLQSTFPAMWLAHTGFGLPLAIYLLRNYVGSLPSSVIESARVDGASHMQIFTRLVIPLSVPAIAAFATLQFLWVWNDLLVALVFLGGTPDVRVLQVALADLQGAFGQNRHLLPAAAFVTMGLPMVVFFGLQRFFVRGLTAGAVKG